MGCCASRAPEKVSLSTQKPLEFNIMPSLVKKEEAVYVLKERCSLKSVIFGQDGFGIKDGSGQDVAKLKQSSIFDFGQDKMELKDCKSDTTRAVIRRARISMRETFYIFTAEKPYKEAELSEETVGNEKLYCWGYMSSARGCNCIEDYEVGRYYYDPEKKDAYKPLYHFKCWTPCCEKHTTIGYLADEETGGVKKTSEDDEEGEAICQVERDAFQWKEENSYGLQVAAGVDAGLMILVMSIIDEKREDAQQNDQQLPFAAMLRS